MNLGERDLFELWRGLLGTTCACYAVVVTCRSLWGWSAYFSAKGRAGSAMRSYAIVHLLRLRFVRFSREFLQIGMWLALLLFLLSRHAR